jgi:hypothetical protein
MCFKKNAAGDGFETDVDSEAFGKMHFSEKYTDEGLHLVCYLILNSI